MSNEVVVDSITKISEQLSKSNRKKLSDPSMTTREAIASLTDKLTVPAGIAAALLTKDVQNVAHGMVIMQASGKTFGALYEKVSDIADGMERYKPEYQYGALYQDVVKVANSEPAYNKSGTYILGRVQPDGQTELIESASVQLKGGYDVDVNMYARDESPNKRYREWDNASARRSFKVTDRETFRKTNGHMSGDIKERVEHSGDEEYYDAAFSFEYGYKQDNLLEQLKQQVNDPDVYLDVVGAPYHYKEADNKLYPSTVRYQGDSLKELVKIAELSAIEPNIGEGTDFQMDMVDLTYAHGKHSQEVRVKRSKLTRPEYQIDTNHPELFSNRNHKRNLTSWVKNTVSSIKDTYAKAKEKGGAFYNRLSGRVVDATAQLEGVLNDVAVLETDGASPVVRPEPTPELTVESAYHTSSNDEQFVEADEWVEPDEQVFVDMESYAVSEPSNDAIEEMVAEAAVPLEAAEQPTPQQTEAQRIVALNAQHARRSLQGRLAAQLDAARNYGRSGPDQ